MAEAFLPYLMLSITKTPVILGTSDTRAHAPYPTEAWICFAFGWDDLERDREEQAPPLQLY